MSTTVMKAAQNVITGTQPPIVGIVSAPTLETTVSGVAFIAVPNLFGVSAKRSQTANKCFECFLRAVPSLTEVKVLHKPGYRPSDEAKNLVEAAAGAKVPPITVTPITVTTAAALENVLDTLPVRDPDHDGGNPPIGVQVLPVDVCLGHAQEIIDLVQGEKMLPVFFPVPDWVTPDTSSALGAYGVWQRRCGVLRAERVAAV